MNHFFLREGPVKDDESTQSSQSDMNASCDYEVFAS